MHLRIVMEKGMLPQIWENRTPDDLRELRLIAENSQDFDIEGKNTINSVENNYIPSANTQKLLRNGQVYILQDGQTYTIQGQKL